MTILTPTQYLAAKRAADDYYSHNHLGHGRWDAQDAEWAAKQALTQAGCPDDEATDEHASAIAASVINDWALILEP